MRVGRLGLAVVGQERLSAASTARSSVVVDAFKRKELTPNPVPFGFAFTGGKFVALLIGRAPFVIFPIPLIYYGAIVVASYCFVRLFKNLRIFGGQVPSSLDSTNRDLLISFRPCEACSLNNRSG
jgi:hypothetical protein